MRLDLFLKWSRIVVRRTLAKQLCDADRVMVNGVIASAGRELEVGDVVEVRFNNRRIRFRVCEIPARPPSKEQSRDLIEEFTEIKQPRCSPRSNWT